MTTNPPTDTTAEKWEREFDEKFAPQITIYGGVTDDPELVDDIKSFIRILIEGKRKG